MSPEVSPGLIDRIRLVRFTPVRLREGYDIGEVDRFLGHLESVVAAGTPHRPLVEAVRFTPVRLREGYDMGEVDDFLAQLAMVPVPPAAAPKAHAQLPDQPPDEPSVAPPAQAVRQQAPSVIEEQRGLLERLFRRR